MSRRFGRLGGPAIAALALLTISSLLPSVAAGPAPASTTVGVPSDFGQGSWAFGVERSISVSGVARDGLTSFSMSASLGWTTIVNQTNRSATSFELTANRTSLGSLSVTYCRPSCRNPQGTATIHERAWQTVETFTNVTTNGSVTTPTGPVAAYAIVNSSLDVKGNLTESIALDSSSLGSSSANLSVATSAHASISFSPALGLFPTDLTSSSWQSNSTYQASGGWDVAYLFVHQPFGGGAMVASGNFPGSFSTGSQPINLSGRLAGAVGLSDGVSTQSVVLSIDAPFALLDGFLLVPAGADLFGGGSGGWGSDASGLQTASTSAVDLGPSAASARHLPLDASATTYEASSTDDGSTPIAPSGSPTTPSAALTIASLPSTSYDGTSPTVLQGEPESVAAAQQSDRCFLSGISCPAVGAAHPFGPIVLGTLLAFGAVVVLVVVAVAARQPPRKLPPSPNASLYPPTLGAAAPPEPERRAPTGKRSGDEPLGHLW